MNILGKQLLGRDLMECELKNYLKSFKNQLKTRVTMKSILCLSLAAVTLNMGIHTYNQTEQFVQEYETSHVGVLYKNNDELAVFKPDISDEISDHIQKLKREIDTKHNVEEVVITDEIEIEEETRSSDIESELIDIEKVNTLLEEQLTLKAHANEVLVDGEQVAKVDKDIESDELIEQVADTFVPDEGELEDVHIDEDIRLEPEQVYPEKIMDKETVVSVLLDGSEYIETYEVESGDSLWSIAEETGKTESQLREANAGLDEDEVLRPGDEIEVEKSESYVNVNATETRQAKEKISYDTEYRTDSSLWWDETEVLESGEKGEREVEYRIIKENGEEKDREVKNSETIDEPDNQVVLRGSAERPSAEGGRFLFPIDPSEGRFTSGYGPRGAGFHSGVDFAAPSGTPIRAADSGEVTFSGAQGGYGNLIIIEHSGGYETYYAHNSENHVTEGEYVDRGAVIGLVGNTGRSTGAHLHFEIHSGGSHIDPLNYFSPQ